MDILNKTICSYPWINLHTNTDGRVKLCCHIYTEDYVKIQGRDAIVGIDSFDDIWHGDYMSNVRNKMLRGQPIKECSRCYEHENKGLISSRNWANTTFPLTQDQINQIYDPIYLELRLGNHCNLKCSGCWSVSSDQLYEERIKILKNDDVSPIIKTQWLHEIKQVESYNYNWFNTNEFKDLIDRVAPTLKRLYLTGGEPTLIPMNVYILDKLIEYNNKGCYVCWTTNMTTWPEEFYNKLDFFNASEIQMSIDGFEDENMYIRYPTSWDILQKNFKKAINLPSKVLLKVYFVYQAWNIFSVKKLVNWLEPIDRKIDFVPIFLESPYWIHSCVWPENIRNNVIKELESITSKKYQNHIDSIIKYTKNTSKFDNDTKNNIKLMKYSIDLHDKYRKYKFADIFPDLNKIIEEIIC